MSFRTVGRVAAAVGVTGAACVTYGSAVELRWYTLRRATLPVLPPGADPLKVLQLSDLHLLPRHRRKIDWVSNLAALEPDLVVNTGDNLSGFDSVPALLEAHGDLLDLPGAFVFGSNDYWSPRMKNPARYLIPGDKRHTVPRSPDLPYESMRTAFTDAGWADLSNAKATVKVNGLRIDLAGVDDPHVMFDDYDRIAGPLDPSADVSIGVVHSPYRRVLDAFVQDGYPLILAGHTHGGQLNIPLYGALVTNCDLDTSRAKGLHTYGAGDRQAALHVSAGLGTSPFAPFRFCCRPEATLLTLVAR